MAQETHFDGLADAGIAPPIVEALRQLVATGQDRHLYRINPLELAHALGISESDAIAAFLQATKLGIFEMGWHLQCPGCFGTLESHASARNIHQKYSCSLCAVDHPTTLDELVEV